MTLLRNSARRRLRDILIGFGPAGADAIRPLMKAANWEVRRTAAYLLREFGGSAGLKELVDVTARIIPMIHAGLATTLDFIKNNPDRVRRYVQAYIEANKIARTDPETAKQIIGKYTKTENREDLDETYNTYAKAWEEAPYVSVAAMQTVLNFSINSAGKTAKPEQFIDNSFVAELDKSGFIKNLYK